MSPEGPTDFCRAPLRAAGTPMSSRRRSRACDEDDDLLPGRSHKRNSPLASKDSQNSARAQVAEAGIFQPSAPCVFSAPASGLFNGAQVAAIVTGAVRDREKQLREEYDELLATRLDEQWRAFAKFNEDQLHQQLGRSQHDYYS